MDIVFILYFIVLLLQCKINFVYFIGKDFYNYINKQLWGFLYQGNKFKFDRYE